MTVKSEILIKKALKLRNDSKFQDAILLLEGVSQSEPKNKSVLRHLERFKVEQFQAKAGVNPPIELQKKLKILFDEKKWEHLIAAIEPVQKFFPNSVPVLNMAGVALRETGDFMASEQHHKKAMKLAPLEPSTYVNLSNALNAQGKFTEGVMLMRSYIKKSSSAPQLNDKKSKIYNCLGINLYYLGLFKDALEAYQTALEYDPDNDEAKFNLGAIRLANKQFKAGWEMREFRHTRPDFQSDSQGISKPQWSGQPNSVLFSWAEQGIGDEIMAACCLNELSALSNQLIVSADQRLIPLFARSFPEIEFISRHDNYHQVACDYHIPSMTALGMLRPSEESFLTSSKGYIKTDQKLVDSLRAKIKSFGGNRPVIGISWKSGAPVTGKARSIKLSQMLDAIPNDYTVVNLQYGDISKEVERFHLKSKRKIHCIEQIDNNANIDGLCALISACEQVVTIDNSTAHFAGALGVRCNLLLPFGPDFRWGALDDQCSYWYQSVKVLRQGRGCNWQTCLAQLSANLAQSE